MTIPDPVPISAKAVRAGTEYVTRRCYAEGYDQGRYGLRYPSGRVEWCDPRPPRMRETPEYVETWWTGYRAGKAAREEFDAQAEVEGGTQADGPAGPSCVCPTCPGESAHAGRARRGHERGGDAAPSRGVAERRAPGRVEVGTGVPHRVSVSG